MERSPVKDIEIRFILKQALTDRINDSKVYMKGIDASYYYEGYAIYKAETLQGKSLNRIHIHAGVNSSSLKLQLKDLYNQFRY